MFDEILHGEELQRGFEDLVAAVSTAEHGLPVRTASLQAQGHEGVEFHLAETSAGDGRVPSPLS